MARKTGRFTRQRLGAFVAAALFGLLATALARAADTAPTIDL